MTLRRTTIISIILALALTLGCAKARAPIPGAVNQFDSDTYVSLVTAKGAIDQAKAELAAGAFPASIADNVKRAVNAAVASYNVADTTYQAYHASALAGQATPGQQQAVTGALSEMNGKINAITSATGGK